MQTEEIRAFDVWKRKGVGVAVRFRCFENRTTGQFCVQSADFYQSPITVSRISELDKQFVELLLEESPFTRSGSFATVEEAISNHEIFFE